MTARPRVPGLNDDWADKQLDLLSALQDAMETVQRAPVQPSPPVCRNCTVVGESPGGTVFSCMVGTPGCLIDRAVAADRLCTTESSSGHETVTEPTCGSCHLVDPARGTWECDPDRPGCPLHDVPEQSR